MNTNEPNQENTNLDPSPRPQNAAWQTPVGVTKANWEYAQANHISEGYDAFLAGDPLTSIDRQILSHYFPDLSNEKILPSENGNPIVADFGCGNGRSLLPFLSRGYRGLGIDLSIPMLQGFGEKIPLASETRQKLTLVQANLVELDAFEDQCVDHAISMFSTLGMIQGSVNRAAFLTHARRMIKPNGLLVLHAHNVWYQLRHPGGVGWAISNAWSAVRKKSEFGDRTSNYRRINDMFIHSFRKKELEHAIRTAGFDKLDWHGILPGADTATNGLSFASAWKTVGWIVVCQ